MAQLAGFKETGMRKIADRMGYRGPMTGFTEYLNANPDKQQMMNSYVNKAMLMASGGYVRKFQEGGFNLPPGFDEQTYFASNPAIAFWKSFLNCPTVVLSKPFFTLLITLIFCCF